MSGAPVPADPTVPAVLVASANAAPGMAAARGVLEAGGGALDAVEIAVRAVEDDPADQSVGYGGLPNPLGGVELDASVMEGTTRQAGAVGALRGYRAAVSVARRVMEVLPHVVVVGDGAARLADEMGLASEDLLTPEAKATWQRGLDGRLQPGDHGASQLRVNAAALATALAADPEAVAGTVNVIARDRFGHLASAVSTSGWAWKWPAGGARRPRSRHRRRPPDHEPGGARGRRQPRGPEHQEGSQLPALERRDG